MEVLLCAIDKLRHLRYLSVDHRFTRLPSSICKLYHLQVLACRNIATSSVLVLNNLINLRHLLPYEFPYANVDGIGTLTSLQGLSFSAGAYNKLSELKDLRELQELRISGLRNQLHDKEVSLVQLCDKKRLRVLHLDWNDDSDAAEEYEKVLDCLHPPDSLKELKIEGYGGARSPYWMEKDLLKNLERVVLSKNAAWKHLPSLGKLPYLNELRLDSLTGLVQIGFEGGFQQLKTLEIRDCEQLEEWSGFGAETAPRWPLLEHLGIRGCPKLKALPPLPLSLQSLVLRGVGWFDSPTLCPATPSSSSSSPSLTHMEIEGCENLTSVAGLLRHRLSALRTLWISRCGALADLHAEEGFQHLHSIDCPKLKMATDVVGLTSLSVLRLSGWNHITSFPSEEACRRLTSLKHLELEDWGGLMSIDDPLLLHVEPMRKLTSVTDLRIRDCGNLECEGDINPWLLRNRTSLRSIYLGQYSTAKSLPRRLEALSSLESLTITGAHQLQSLPRMPSSLRSLWIYGCNETLVERCAQDEGADWPNIKHIRWIEVSYSDE